MVPVIFCSVTGYGLAQSKQFKLQKGPNVTRISHDSVPDSELNFEFPQFYPQITLSNYLIKPNIKGSFVGLVLLSQTSNQYIRIEKDTAKLLYIRNDSIFLRPKRSCIASSKVQRYGFTLRIGHCQKDMELLVDAFEKNRVIAHRGAWKNTTADQNTIESFQKATELRCHGSEFDVWLTLDKKIVLSHDPYLKGMAVEKSTLEQLSDVRLSKGGKVSTLEELIVQAKKQNSTKMILEIKPSTIDKKQGIELADSVISTIHRLKAQAWTEYISFDYEVLCRIKYLDPSAKTHYLGGDKNVETVKRDGLTGIDYSFYSFRNDPNLIRSAHKEGLTVNVWTVNQPQELEIYHRSEVDYITTDEPELLLKMR